MRSYARWPVLKQTGPNKALSSDAVGYRLLASDHPCFLFDVIVTNLTEDTLYLLVFDQNTLPADNETPTLPPVRVPALSTGSISYVKGRPVMNGIAVALSTSATAASFQGLDSAGWFDVTYF